ncbi:MAG: tetratricopeptide repeat protein [Bacteroidia bacterium]
MKIIIKFLLITVVTFSKLFSQNNERIVDSLTTLLLNKKLPDTSIYRLKSDIGQIAYIDRYSYWDSIINDCETILKKQSNTEVNLKLNYYIAGALNNKGFLNKLSGNTDKALVFFNQSLNQYNKLKLNNNSLLCKKILIDKAQTINNIATLVYEMGDIVKGKEYHNKSLQIRIDADDKEGIALSLNNLGYVSQQEGNIKQSIDYYFKSLKIRESIKDWNGMAQVYGNIASIYIKYYGIEQSMHFHRKSLYFYSKIESKSGIGHALNNLGTCYSELNQIDSALFYYQKALKYRVESRFKKGIGNSYYNIGRIYLIQKKYIEAQKKLDSSLIIFNEMKDISGKVKTLKVLGELYVLIGNFPKAKEYTELSLKIANQIKSADEIQRASRLLYIIYSRQNQPAQALKMYELHINIRDSILNVENKKNTIIKQFEYEYDKKVSADSLKIADERKITEIKLKQERTQRYALYIGLTVTCLFGAFIFNRFKVTQKQKNTIETKEKQTQEQNIIISNQKHLIEERHKEITDSINYAERIQRSLLANKQLLNENFPDYFILFKPKDVVSGDFYWASKLNKNTFALVTADSTGHGVPGAIMSILNIACLNEAVKEGYQLPNEILNRTRKEIITVLKRDGSPEGGKDGMDCSLLVFDFKNLKLQIAAANNPVWIVRSSVAGALEANDNTFKNFNSTFSIYEVKPDKMPVGKHDKQDVPFTLHEIDIQKGDLVYTLTDGFPDQFGGEKGKKYMIKNLRELIISIAHLPMHEQKQILEQTFNNWKGTNEQVDDVTVVGIKI